MSNNKFKDLYSKYTTQVLMEKLESHRNGSVKLGDEWYFGLMEHLLTRELTEAQKEFIGSEDSISAEKNNQQNYLAENNHPAGQTIADIIFALAIVIGFAAAAVGIYLFTLGEGGLMAGIFAIFGGVIAAILLVAVSEVIKLLINIEYNTRQATKKS